MPLKVMGMAMIILTTGLAGISLSGMLSARVSGLRAIILMLDRISTYISFRALHTGEILAELAADKSLSELKFLSHATELYRSGRPFHDSWAEAVRNDCLLGNEEKAQLILMGDALGTSNTKGQLSMIRVYSQNINQIYETVNFESKNKGKLYRTLGILTGIFISVMLM